MIPTGGNSYTCTHTCSYILISNRTVLILHTNIFIYKYVVCDFVGKWKIVMEIIK